MRMDSVKNDLQKKAEFLINLAKEDFEEYKVEVDKLTPEEKEFFINYTKKMINSLEKSTQNWNYGIFQRKITKI